MCRDEPPCSQYANVSFCSCLTPLVAIVNQFFMGKRCPFLRRYCSRGTGGDNQSDLLTTAITYRTTSRKKRSQGRRSFGASSCVAERLISMTEIDTATQSNANTAEQRRVVCGLEYTRETGSGGRHDNRAFYGLWCSSWSSWLATVKN